jgi:FAD/FMN-containing dehydrogenase
MNLRARLEGLGMDVTVAGDGIVAVKPRDASEVARAVGACRETPGVRAIEIDGLLPAPIWETGANDDGPDDDAERLCLDLGRLDEVSINVESHLVAAGAGLTVSALETALGGHGFTLGWPDVPDAPLGAWLATAEPGPGSSRAYPGWSPVAGVEAVLLDGTPFRTTLAPRSASGPDPKALLVGGRGRIGVITRVTLRIHPADASRKRLVFAFPEPTAAVGAVVEALGRDVHPDGFGLLDGGVAEAVLTWETRGEPRRVALVSLAVDEVCVVAGGRRLSVDTAEGGGHGGRPLAGHRGAAGPSEVREAAARSGVTDDAPIIAIGFGARWSRVVLVRRALLNALEGRARVHLERALPEGAVGIVCVPPEAADVARGVVREAGGWLVGDGDGESWIDGVAGALLGAPS